MSFIKSGSPVCACSLRSKLFIICVAQSTSSISIKYVEKFGLQNYKNETNDPIYKFVQNAAKTQRVIIENSTREDYRYDNIWPQFYEFPGHISQKSKSYIFLKHSYFLLYLQGTTLNQIYFETRQSGWPEPKCRSRPVSK